MAQADGFMPYSLPALSPEEAHARAVAFRESVATRRSVRHFSDRPVDLRLVEEAVRCAGLAPNGANMQPWTFVLVTDPDIRRRIREAAEAEERETYERRMSDEWREALAPLGTDWRKPHLTEAPCLLVVFEQAHGVAADGSRVTHYYVKESVGIACGFLILALHEAGLATLTHTPSPMGFLRDVLGRPVNEKAFVLLPIGYPAEGCEVPRIAKKPLDQILVRK